MLTTLAKRQLLVFVLITLVGIAYTGARYARLDRLVHDSSYRVNAHFAQSGGIFAGAEVTYRGVHIGRVSDMRLTDRGVDVILSIEGKYDDIPADTTALVANKSAIGEQYVDLEPRTDRGPYLKDGSGIALADTRLPISPTELLTNVDRTVRSVPLRSLRTVVDEMGSAFHGTAPDLARLIDTSSEFIAAANDNLDVTSALIKDSNAVLRTQADKGSAIRQFSRDLALFSGTLAANDNYLRTVVDNGSATATELRAFLELNKVDLGSLIRNLVVTGRILVKHLPGIRQVLVVYPYLTASAYTAVARGADGYAARFGLALQLQPPVCHLGYDPAERHQPEDLTSYDMDEDAHCAEPATVSNARGAQNAPRAWVSYDVTDERLEFHDGPTPPASGSDLEDLLLVRGR